jgi:hypothetical protein
MPTVKGGLDPHMINLWKMEILILCITVYGSTAFVTWVGIYVHLLVTAAK